MRKTLLAVSLLLSIAACQKDPSRTNAELQGADTLAEPQLVEAADGTLYSKSCLQENASKIQTQGSSAMGACKMKITLNSDASSGEVERTRFFYSNSYAWIYYPPTYCKGENTTSSNSFCSYIFGGSYSFNCYALFGYTNQPTYSGYNQPSYSSYYNPSCNYCLYAPNPTRCQNKCVRYQYFNTY